MHALGAILNAAACLLVSWVAGSYLLRQSRPRGWRDLFAMLAALGVAVYGIGVAVAPLQGDLFQLGWRISLAAAAALFYDRHFGWGALLACLAEVPRGWRAWWRHHIDAGRAASRQRSGR